MRIPVNVHSLRKEESMLKKKTVIYTVIVIIMLFVLSNEYRTVWNPQLEGSSENNNGAFLSSQYFHELEQLYERIRLNNEQWYIFDDAKQVAAKAVVDKMMEDLVKQPEALMNHVNDHLFFEMFDKNIRRLGDITQEIHYFRNVLNEYSGAPERLTDMIELTAQGKWRLFSARFHRYHSEDMNAALNVKFISADGRFEVVYNAETEELVTDAVNMGTYNYAPGSLHPLKYYRHYRYDVAPWKKWGNVEDVSYEDIMKLESKHGTAEEKKNSSEIEEKIKQVKKQLQ